MFKLNVLAATRTIEKTMPFMLYRLLLCLGLGLAFLLVTLIGAGTVIAFAAFSKNPSTLSGFGAALGFIASAYGVYRFRTIWLYHLTARHLALLSAQIKGETIPEGKAQIDYARQRVTSCFPSGEELNTLDQATAASLMSISALRSPITVANPALQKAVNTLIGWLFTAHRQTVLAWHFYSGAENGWQSASVALTCLAEHFRETLKNRLILTAFEWIGFGAAYYFMLYPTGLVADALPVSVGIWQYVFALVFAWGLKMAFFEPISQATLMESLFPHIKASPEQKEALSRESEAFRELLKQSQK